jgi:hypothetical protein
MGKEDEDFQEPSFRMDGVPAGFNTVTPNPKGAVVDKQSDVDENASSDTEQNVRTVGGREVAQKEHERIMTSHYGHIPKRGTGPAVRIKPQGNLLESIVEVEQSDLQKKPQMQNPNREQQVQNFNRDPVIEMLSKSKKKEADFTLLVKVEVPTKELFMTLKDSFPDSMDGMVVYISGLVQKVLPEIVKKAVEEHYA